LANHAAAAVKAGDTNALSRLWRNKEARAIIIQILTLVILFAFFKKTEVIARSSNVGAIKSGLMVGGPALWRQIHAFGFGQPTGVDLPGENPGIVRDGRRWRPVETAYASFGQSISVTALQLAMAASAVANGGSLYRPYVVAAVGSGAERRVTRPVELGQPIGPATARSLERLLEAVVEEGTGKGAAVPGYAVAGKTGTAQVAVNGGYSRDRHVASFVGFVPARRPVLLGLVSIDEPRGPLFHGGDVAAPVFGAILRQALPYVDDFLPIHNLSSVEDLASRLESLERHRPVRKQQPVQLYDRPLAATWTRRGAARSSKKP